MRSKTLLFSLGLALFINCTQPTKKDDPEKLTKVLIDYFEGIKTRDLKKMNENTTTDYVLFESGKVWNNDSLWTALQAFEGQRIEFRLDNFNVKVDNESGHITYFNHGDIYVKDTLNSTIEWIENATFQKVNDQWKIDFLQSTLKSK
ncbi:MAG TPA: nuclear transport factor 2 family protein [Cyclobacteriaceae bacterium]|nr:nuclear transport factor 2 family protein [Cyclobacteriaceae bacterium]